MAPGPYSVAKRRADHSGRRRALIAASSVALATIIGMAAIYVATFPSGRGSDPNPAAALLVSSTPAPTGSAVDDVVDQGAAAGVASGPSVGLEEEPDLAAVEEAEAGVAAASGAANMGAVAATLDVDGVATLDVDGAGSGLPAGAADVPVGAVLVDEPDTVIRRGWVCDGEIKLVDPRGRDWSLGRVSFLSGSGFERVVLHLERIGPGSGEPSSVTAEAFPTAAIRSTVAGVRQPSVGKRTISLHLADGIKGNLGLRGYRPSGLRNIKEFSVYPAARGSSRVLVSAATERCFRVRVPAWSVPSASSRNAQILLDIRS